jgi:triacylglycerol esterase/lipase EstA (alpha/beta hydrolase family)
MKDLESYYSPVYLENNEEKVLVRDAILERLTYKLREHKDKKILLIAHSMGSIISHDVLIERLPDIQIDTLITIGSPMGQKYVIDKYTDEQKQKSITKLRVPDNIKKHWYNFADLEDQVAINNTLSKYYKKSSNNLEVDDKIVRNNYVYNGDSNPHKSFGYLRTSETAEVINSFLVSRYTNMYVWVKNKIGRIFTNK